MANDLSIFAVAMSHCGPNCGHSRTAGSGVPDAVGREVRARLLSRVVAGGANVEFWWVDTAFLWHRRCANAQDSAEFDHAAIERCRPPASSRRQIRFLISRKFSSHSTSCRALLAG